MRGKSCSRGGLKRPTLTPTHRCPFATYSSCSPQDLPKAYLHACGLLYHPRFRELERAVEVSEAAAALPSTSTMGPPSAAGAGAQRQRQRRAPQPCARVSKPAAQVAGSRQIKKAAKAERKAQRKAKRQRKKERRLRKRQSHAGTREMEKAIRLAVGAIGKGAGAVRAGAASKSLAPALLGDAMDAADGDDEPVPLSLLQQVAAVMSLRRSLADAASSLQAAPHAQADIAAGVLKWHAAAAAAEAARREAVRKERLAALRQNDYAAYQALLKVDTTERIKGLLARTDAFLGAMARKLAGTQSMAPAAGSSACGADDVEPSKQLCATLRPYQLTGLRWLVSLHRSGTSGCLADEMGLGKTLQVIALLCHLVESTSCTGPFLIVLPASVVANWAAEFTKFAPHLAVCLYTGPEARRREVFAASLAGWLRAPGKGALKGRATVCLTTFETVMAKSDGAQLVRLPWQYLIMDEAHRIKNGASKLNVLLRDQFCRVPHRLLITGTPVQNNLRELFTLLQFLMPRVFAGEAESFVRLFESGETDTGEALPAASASDGEQPRTTLDEEERMLLTQRLHEALRPFMLRRVKESVAADLPGKREILLRCTMPPYQRHLYNCVLNRVATAVAGPAAGGDDGASCSTAGAGGGGRSVRVANALMELRTVCNHPFLSKLHNPADEAVCGPHPVIPLVRHCAKLELLDRVLSKMHATGHRVLLFSTMTRVLDVLEEYLQWRGYSFVRLDGNTSADARGETVRKFQEPGSTVFCFLLSVRAGGFGLNLQAADTVIMVDTDWNPQVDAQAQARSHRIGQDKDVLVLRLECCDTVEEAVRTKCDAKRGVADRAITGGFFDGGLTSELERSTFLRSLLRSGGDTDGAAPDAGGGTLSEEALNALLARRPEEIPLFEAECARRTASEVRFWGRAAQGAGASRPLAPRLADAVSSASLVARLELRVAAAVAAASGAGQALGRGARKRTQVDTYVESGVDEFREMSRGGGPSAPRRSDTPDGPPPQRPRKAARKAPSVPVQDAASVLAEPAIRNTTFTMV